MNKLARLKEFQQVLADYEVSAASLKILREACFVLLAAPTSAGRNTIIRELQKTEQYHYVVSDTTRKPRMNDGVMEQDGVEYWFRTESEMLDGLKKGEYFEAAIIHNQQVSGMNIRELKQALEQKKIAITDIEIVGTETIMKEKPDALAVFVLPPSFDEWQHRLKHRGEMRKEEVRRRLESAKAEFGAALQHRYYRFVINDTVEHAMEQIHEMALYDKIDPEQQTKGRALAEQLYLATVDHLRTDF